MRQQHRGEFCEIFRLVLFEPENLRDGEAGENRVAHGLAHHEADAQPAVVVSDQQVRHQRPRPGAPTAA